MARQKQEPVQVSSPEPVAVDVDAEVKPPIGYFVAGVYGTMHDPFQLIYIPTTGVRVEKINNWLECQQEAGKLTITPLY